MVGTIRYQYKTQLLLQFEEPTYSLATSIECWYNTFGQTPGMSIDRSISQQIDGIQMCGRWITSTFFSSSSSSSSSIDLSYRVYRQKWWWWWCISCSTLSSFSLSLSFPWFYPLLTRSWSTFSLSNIDRDSLLPFRWSKKTLNLHRMNKQWLLHRQFIKRINN